MINKKIPFIASIAIVSLVSLLLAIIILNEIKLLSLNNGSVVAPNPLPQKSIVIISPLKGETISSPLNITGYINGGDWSAFEGQAGRVELIDDQEKIIGQGVLTAVTDWMQPLVYFETEIEYNPPIGGNGFLVFYNENPSGIDAKNQNFKLPVVFETRLSQTTEVLVYFSNNTLDSDISCNKVFPVKRQIKQTEAIARATLMELLSGPQKEETEAGYNTNINVGTKLNSIVIDNGTARVDFDATLEKEVGGSCRIIAIISQITETLKQFPTIEKVIISIDGKTEEILQP